MKNISSLHNVLLPGKYGDYENKNNEKLLKISEVKNLFLCQIVKYRNSDFNISKVKIDNLSLPSELKTIFNNSTRILWMGPGNWLITSSNKEILKEINDKFNTKDFAITDLSHSRTIVEIEGDLTYEVIKKGCPLNINYSGEGDCANSVYHAITITIDFLKNNPKTVRIFALRSFGESLYESLTDACLEYGYKAIK